MCSTSRSTPGRSSQTPFAATRATGGFGPSFREEILYDGPLDGAYGGTFGGSCDGACGAYGCDDGLCDHVCGACGTTGCTPATCDPMCERDLACGGPVVCNKFGRSGKFYTNATRRDACGLSAGYAFLFLRPHQGDATAAVVRNVSPGGTVSRRREFDFDLTTGSRIFVELIRPDVVGLRLTYSGLEADSDRMRFAAGGGGLFSSVTSAAVPAAFSFNNEPSGVLFAGPDQTLTARSEVQFSSFDFDATKRLRAGRWLLNAGGGFRIARLEQRYSALTLGPFGGEAESEHVFSGGGVTAFAEARRPVGNSGFALLSSARVAFLAGDNETEARVSQFGTAVTGASSRRDFVPVGEVQLGAEWSAWVNPTTLFFTQAAYEGHIWGGVGGPGSEAGSVGFTGFNLTLGVEW